MKFKEFINWCNQRACDGCWGATTAMICIELIEKVGKVPFWKRERYWRREYEQIVLEEIVNPTEEKIKEMRNKN